MPGAGKGLVGTELKDEYAQTGLFETAVPYRITVTKSGQELFMYIRGDGREQLCHFRNVALPPIVEGRIGLRHMYTRGARYRHFRVSVPAEPYGPESQPRRKSLCENQLRGGLAWPGRGVSAQDGAG